MKVMEELKQYHYDLVLLDIMLPGMSGYDICRRIRDEIDIPILMVTARAEAVDVIRGLGLGADDYITKPFDPSQLVARVRSHLKRYRRLTEHFGDHSLFLSGFWRTAVRAVGGRTGAADGRNGADGCCIDGG